MCEFLHAYSKTILFYFRKNKCRFYKNKKKLLLVISE